MNFKLLALFSLFSTFIFSQEENVNFYTNLSVYSHLTSEEKSIEEIVVIEKNTDFLTEENPKLYKELGNKTWWYKFSIKPTKKEDFKYLSIGHSYLSYGKVYVKKGNKIDSLYQVSNFSNFPHKHIFYRDPVWKIPLDSMTITDVFLELKSNGGRTRLDFHLETENEFLKRVETEYIYFGLFLAFLISMTLVLVFFAVLKKEYVVLLYAIYVITALIEFLAGKGLGVQYFWSDSSFIVNNARSLSQTIGTFFIGLFYLKFYKLNKDQYISKNIFRWGSFATIPLLCIYMYKFFYGGFGNLYLYVWSILKIIIFIWILNHIYLASKKQIPKYLVVAFVLPIAAVINGQSINPSVYSKTMIALSGPNLYYFALAIEILLFTRYIFDSVIKTQKKYFTLKKVSDELKYDFQNKTLEVQQIERNKLLSNVHDTFGGYLEALKLRLLQKNQNSPEKVQEILDAFYKDYRYLLNSLYSPKINSENFVKNLIEFCEKLNELTDNIIKYEFSLENTQLEQEQCVHIYRIISELTTNAIKYSKASEIKIEIQKEGKEQIILSIKDNGIGFDINTVNKNSYGLKNIENRVQQINGSLEIQSVKNIGTSFTIKIPKNE